MTTVLLIRHGETEWNRLGRWQGHADVPLSAHGVQQAAALAARLQVENVHIDHLYASDLQRAFVTAEHVAAALGMRAQPVAHLRELDVGSWSGLDRHQIREQYPGAFETIFYAPDGEHRDAFISRVGAALADLTARHPGECLAIVTHGGTIRAMLRYVLQDWNDTVAIPHIGNTSITTLQFQDGTWTIARVNDMQHVDGAQAIDVLQPKHNNHAAR